MNQPANTRFVSETAMAAGLAGYAPIREMTLFQPLALKKWRRALGRVRSGTSDAKILCAGDSTTAGVQIDSNGTQGLPTSWPYALARILNGVGIPAVKGMGVPGPSTQNEDPRYTVGTGWDRPFGYGWGARSAFRFTGTTYGTLTYADTGIQADTFDIYYAISSGSFTAQATGGTAVASPGLGGIQKLTVSAGTAATSNVLTITPAGATVFIIGVEPYLSVGTKIRVANAGVGGSRAITGWSADGSGAGYNSQAAIKKYAPDLTIIMLGTNDALDAAAPSPYIAAMQKIITAAQASGDVVLISPVPPYAAANANVVANVPPLTAALPQLGLPLANLSTRWISGDDAGALGLMGDSIHPGMLGHADIAQMISRPLINA